VLASLPEIDEQGLPRLGSLQSIPEPEQQFVESLLSGEKNSHGKGNRDEPPPLPPVPPPPQPGQPQFRRRNLQRGMHSGQQQHSAATGSQSFSFGRLPVGPWKMGRPVDGVYDRHQFDKFMTGQMLELGPSSSLRPTALTLRPAFEGPGGEVSYTNLAKPDDEVQSTLRSSSPMGHFSAGPSNVDGLESVFSFNYDQPRSTINALLPVSMGYGAPNTELGFSGVLRGKANDGYNPA
jgi:hypothetical protein